MAIRERLEAELCRKQVPALSQTLHMSFISAPPVEPGRDDQLQAEQQQLSPGRAAALRPRNMSSYLRDVQQVPKHDHVLYYVPLPDSEVQLK